MRRRGGFARLHRRATFAELRASLAEAVNASLDDAGEEFAVELYVKVDDLQAAAMELGDAS